MKYNTVKNASNIIKESPYLVGNPKNYKNRWNEDHLL